MPILSYEEKIKRLKAKMLEEDAEAEEKRYASDQVLLYHRNKARVSREIVNFIGDIPPECVFYIIRPEPLNVPRLKFGISTHFAGRLDQYLCACPELELVSLWRVPRNTSYAVARQMIRTLTKNISKQIGPEVFDIKDFTEFEQRVKYLQRRVW